MPRRLSPITILLLLALIGAGFWKADIVFQPAWAGPPVISNSAEIKPPPADKPLRSLLDAPLLFTRRHSYQGSHIYDTYYQWRAGGGIYVLENPWAPPEKHVVRPVIDSATPGTLGEGIYYDPELSWDGKRLLFCFKGEANGDSCIYEIGVDGRGLRRLTDPSTCQSLRGRFTSHHDVGPAYLPDGRIIFTSTRLNGLVPCNNTGVDILHVMNADGTGLHAISVNNVNEFDPVVMPDGRILHGRWEYVDKTALTQQSLWTIYPDGTNETAFFANNLVHPEAFLDARPVPGSPHLVAAAFTPHNSPPRGTVGLVDMCSSKNSPASLINFENKQNPTHDRGNSCEPWPLSRHVLLFSGRPAGQKCNAIEMMDINGRRETILSDPAICLHDPMLIKPQTTPPVITAQSDRAKRNGRFFLQDIYRGLTGVKRGAVKWLRVLEETTRTSPTPNGAYNQTFLVSAALAFSVKIFHGVVPVHPDGSAYFEVPSGRTLYLQALDADGRLVQSMRTFVQAAPGVTRSCIGCHEHKSMAPPNTAGIRMPLLGREPDRLRPESWGTGYLDFTAMVQPVLDRHCVSCHGGEKGIAARLDLTGGWTEHFNISYENLVSRRRTQLTASLIAGIDCMNGTALWSARIFGPRKHGSGAAPLAEVLVSGHKDRIPNLTRRERDLLMAWIDTNGLFHGSWDYSDHGCQLKPWPGIKQRLIDAMGEAGCLSCHAEGNRIQFEDDWFNLKHPGLSRILRAPLAAGGKGRGLAWCRKRKAGIRKKRIRMMLDRGYVHHVLPISSFKPEAPVAQDLRGEPVVTFASVADPNYQAMLRIIQQGRRQALAVPRVDMPGARVRPGESRHLLPVSLPASLPALSARVDADGVVQLSWPCSADNIGLSAEVYRGDHPGFKPESKTLLASTKGFHVSDTQAHTGKNHYALVLVSRNKTSPPIRQTITVPELPPPPVPSGLAAVPSPGFVDLSWPMPESEATLHYHIYRKPVDHGDGRFKRLTQGPLAVPLFIDGFAEGGMRYVYSVTAVNRRGVESPHAKAVAVTALKLDKRPVFSASFRKDAHGAGFDGASIPGKLHGKAKAAPEGLDLRQGGYVTFPHKKTFDLGRGITIDCRVHFTREAAMPVVLSCGVWNQAGWFLQRIGSGWRWHVGGIDCDGGRPVTDRPTRLTGTFDGRTARLYQDGKLVAEKQGSPILMPWNGPLHIGQYSGRPGPSYQVNGWISDVAVYRYLMTERDLAPGKNATSKK